MQEVWAVLDREEVVALGLFIAVTILATLCLRRFLQHVSKTEVETELLLWGCPAHLQSLCWGQEQCGELSSEGLAVLLFSSTDPQKEVCPQRAS